MTTDTSHQFPKASLLQRMLESGLPARIASLQKNCLTVVCYHRIGELRQSGFQGFESNMSASPRLFTQQMELLKRCYNPVTLKDVAQWLCGGGRLPPRPVLVTFDDGYRDNMEVAWPIMRERGIPAVIFLATGHIETARPFLWDFVSYCFHAAPSGWWTIPLLGDVRIATSCDRSALQSAWMLVSKAHPASQRWADAHRLAEALGVSPPADAFKGLYLNWEDVAFLADRGVEFGGHTKTHPILTKIPPAEACAEIADSFSGLASVLGTPPIGFAYPNGTAKDFDSIHEEAARKAGYSLAFTLRPGPMHLAELRRRPMAIRRLYIGNTDNMPRFAAKLAGAGRLRNLFD